MGLDSGYWKDEQNTKIKVTNAKRPKSRSPVPTKPTPTFDWADIERCLGIDQKPPANAVTAEIVAKQMGICNNNATKRLVKAVQKGTMCRVTLGPYHTAYYWPKETK